MTFTNSLILAACFLAWSGCSSTRYKVDAGPVRARTFAFVNAPSRAQPTYAENREAIHTLIKDAITRNLAGRGVERVQTGGDVTVAYLVIIGNNATTTSLNDYFGYGRDAAALVEGVHREQTERSKNPNYFEAGTLVIDLVDTQTFSLLYRGSVTRQVLRNVPTDVRAARIQEVVDEALKSLRTAQ